MKTYDLSVVGSAYNEGNNIVELVERLQVVFQKKKIDGEIVLLNDKSTDNTGEIMDGLARKHPNLRIFHNEKNLGIAGSWKKGIHAARGAYVCLMDTDLQNLPEDVYNLYREITFTNTDIVQGWRSYVGKTLHTPQYFLSRGLNKILNFCFRMRMHDNKSGFVIARKEVLVDVMRHKRKYYYFGTFITVAANAKGYTIREIETLFAERKLGTSYLYGSLLKTSLKTVADIWNALFEFRIFDWYDTTLHDFIETHAPHIQKATHSLRYRVYHFFFPLHHWMISYNATRYYEDLERSQWLSPEAIREFQNTKLRQLIAHSYYHTSFYRESMNERGLTPGDFHTIEDLQKLPILDKSTVREQLHLGLLSNNHCKHNVQKVTTSGSTGSPLTVYAEKKQLEMRWAATLRSQRWTGYRFGDRCVRLWHQTIGMSPSQIIRERIDAFFCRRTFIPAYQIGEHNIRQFLDRIENARPTLIDGYAESFNFLSIYLKGKNLTTAKPLGIISSAQMLPKQSRATIEEAFKCKVFDKYGSREFSGIAYECEAHRGHHVVAESYIVEILKEGKPAKPGEMGEVVITDLNNYVMPLIRYRVGDIARATDEVCPCGRGLPLIGDIEGRTQSIIIGTQKQYVPGSFFLHFLKDYDHAIRQFQIEQQELGKLIFRIVKAHRFTDEILDEILATFQEYVGPNMEFIIEYVDSIQLSRTGKVQVCLSKLNLDFQTLSLAPLLPRP